MEGSSSGQDDYSRLPLDDRLAHKLWKARMCAYEEITAALGSASQSVLSEHFETARRAPLTETNAAAQEAAFAMLLQYTRACPWGVAMKLRPHVLGPVAEKGLVAGKPGTRSKTVSILAAFIACDSTSEPVVSELVKIATQNMKQPKLVAAIAQALRELLLAFSAAVILNDDRHQQQLPAFLSACFLHADKTVRQEAFDFVVAASQWSPNYWSLLSGLKPLQVKELRDAAALAHSQDSRPQATAFLRGHQPADSPTEDVDMSASVDRVTAWSNDGPPEDATESEAAPPVNILESLPPNFSELVESAKWKDRKDILDALLPVVKAPRIEEGRYGELVGVLVKKVADVNILVAIAAANCLEGLARGLRAHFSPYRSDAITALLDRCKEKKSNVVQAMRDALAGCMHCIQSISDIVPELQAAAASKNPQVRHEAFAFASAVLQRAPKQCLKKDLKDLTEMIAGGLESADPQVRDASHGAMASLFTSAGEKTVAPFLEKVDKAKLAKVRESMNNNSDKPAPNPVATVPAKRPNERSNQHSVRPPPPPKETSRATMEAAREPAGDSFEVNVQGVSESHATEHAIQVFGPEIVAKLSSAVWKERLEAMDAVAAAQPALFPSTELMVKFLSKTPGWKESNFQVFGKMLQALQKEAQLSREAAALIVDGVVDKLSDAKLQRDTTALLLKCASSTCIGFLVHHLLAKLQAPLQKNPKVLADGCKFICTALLEFGTVSIKIAGLVDALKAFLQHPNPSVRSASVQVAATLHSFLGTSIKLLFSDQSPTVLAILDAEFAKAGQPPIRQGVQVEHGGGKSQSMTAGQSVTASQSVTGSQFVAAPAPQPAEDLTPRPDVTSIVQSIVPKLSDANWKTRKEGLDDIHSLLERTAGRMSVEGSCVLDLMSALKGRFSDTNKNLSVQALELSGLTLQALGSRTSSDRAIPSCRSLVQSAMQCLADIKVQVRLAALKCLDDLVPVFPPSLFIGVAGACIGSCESPNLRKELVTWLARPLSMTVLGATDEDVPVLFTAIVSCLQDRSGDVRKAATLLLPSITPSDLFLRHVQRTSPSLLPTIQPLLNANGATNTTNRPKTPVKSLGAVGKKTPSKSDTVGFFLDNANAAAPVNARSIAKWPFDGQSAPRKEQVDALEQQAKDLLTPQATGLLFSTDFREQIAGMSLLEKSFEDDFDGSLARLQGSIDVLLRYLTIRLFDSNTTVLLKCLDVLEVCLRAMDNGGSRMSEADAAAFLPFFINRLGEWREGGSGGGGGGSGQRQQRVKAVLRLLCRVYPASKLFNHLGEWGLRAKSNKTRSGCLEEMGTLLTRNGCSVITPSKHVPLIAGCVGDRDAAVRNAALNVLVQLHRLLGAEAIYKQLTDGVMTQKDMDMVEERLKRTDLHKDEDPEDMPQEALQPPPTPLLHDINPFAAEADALPRGGETCSQNVNNLTPTMPIIRPIKTNYSTSSARQHPATTLSLDHHPLDNEVDLIGCSSDSQCILALQRLDEHLNGKPSDELIARADPLITALSIRLRAICLEDSVHGQHDPDHEHVRLRSRLCRYVCNALVLLSSNLEVTARIGEDTLETLIANTLHALLSPTINDVFTEDKEQLLKALNVLLVKSLEGCHPNHCYRALLRLLTSAFRSPNAKDDKYPELVMKCLWKATKGLVDSIDHQVISIEELLRDIDRFLRNIPPIEWKTRCAKKMAYEDLPLRTVKTIIHELVQKFGLLVQDHWTLLDDDSFVISYCKQFLDSSGLNVAAAPDAKPEEAKALSEFELEMRLKSICDCICSKPDTRMGLLELHELQTQYGRCAGDQIEAFIASLGPFFQKYIKRGLARIDSELKSARPDHTSAEELTVQEYKERLASLRSQMFGADLGNHAETMLGDQQQQQGGSPVRNRLESPAAKFARFTAGSAPGSPLSAKKAASGGLIVDPETSITSLRERLARLKNNETSQ